MAPLPLVTVVIPTLNSERTLERTLQSLGDQSAQPLEVFVVDGGSKDRTVELAKKSRARVLVGRDKSTARNQGAAAANAPFLLFLDSDIEAPPNLIAECLSEIDRFDALCIKERVIASDYWGRARGLEKASFYRSTIWEAARFFRKEVFSRLGGYNVRLGSSFEDMDLQFRLISAGAKVGWVDAALMHHEEGVGLMEYLRKRSRWSLRAYAADYPEQWAQFLSPVDRLIAILRYAKSIGSWNALSLLPGIVILRWAEYIVRLR